MSHYNSTLWGILTKMVGWIYPLSTPPSTLKTEEDDSVAKEWEWLLSTAEEIAIKHGKQRASEIQEELNRIKKVSPSVRYQKLLISKSFEFFRTLDPETVKILSESRLDPSKRDRIIRDAVRSVSPAWVFDILGTIFSRFGRKETEGTKDSCFESFSGRWYEQPYKRNICGELISMGWRASHVASERGLTPAILGDILWSFHLCLSREISSDLPYPLEEADYEYLCEKVMSIADPLVKLWRETSVKVGSISTREGILPKKWELEHVKEVARLEKIKQNGVAARFNDGPADPLWRKHLESVVEEGQTSKVELSNGEPLVSKTSFRDRRDLLSKSLTFHLPERRMPKENLKPKLE